MYQLGFVNMSSTNQSKNSSVEGISTPEYTGVNKSDSDVVTPPSSGNWRTGEDFRIIGPGDQDYVLPTSSSGTSSRSTGGDPRGKPGKTAGKGGMKPGRTEISWRKKSVVSGGKDESPPDKQYRAALRSEASSDSGNAKQRVFAAKTDKIKKEYKEKKAYGNKTSTIKRAYETDAVDAQAKLDAYTDEVEEAMFDPDYPERQEEEEQKEPPRQIVYLKESEDAVLQKFSTPIVTSNVRKVRFLLRYFSLLRTHQIGRAVLLATPLMKAFATFMVLLMLKRAVLLPGIKPIAAAFTAATAMLNTAAIGGVAVSSVAAFGPVISATSALGAMATAVMAMTSWIPAIGAAAVAYKTVPSEALHHDYFWHENTFGISWVWGDRKEFGGEMVNDKDDRRSFSAQTTSLKRGGAIRDVILTVTSSRGKESMVLNVVEELVNEVLSGDKAKFSLNLPDFQIYLQTRISTLSTAINIPRNDYVNHVGHTLLFCENVWKQRKLELQAGRFRSGLDEVTGTDF